MDFPSPPAHFGRRRYFSWNDWVRETHGGRLQKVSVAAPFTCPNRDGTRGVGGCTFCNNAGFTPGYLDRRETITAQIERGLAFLRRRYPDTLKYLAYFQTYSNTYGEFETLRAIYEEALAHPDIGGLVIGTRPDCVADTVLDYLAERGREVHIELELGIESTDNATLVRINRGHDFATSVDAINRAASRGLSVTGHMIFGLPGESRESMLAGAARLSALPLAALKFHQLQLVRGTALAREWEAEPESVPLLSEDEYLELLADFVERLSPQIRLQRLGSEVPPKLKLAPTWNLRLSELAPRLNSLLEARGSWQGWLFNQEDQHSDPRKLDANPA